MRIIFEIKFITMKNNTHHLHYETVAKAIDFIDSNSSIQPTLEQIAAHVHLSPFHFQRIFTEWAGVSPKKFLQYTTLFYAKSKLRNSKDSLLFSSEALGLSSSGRLHDLFVNIIAMTPNEYRQHGTGLVIHYEDISTPFGNAFVASTQKGICKLCFYNSFEEELNALKLTFKNAEFICTSSVHHQKINHFFNDDFSDSSTLSLHLKGTSFQLQVWQALLNIPTGELSTYGDIGKSIQKEKASRAIGTAIGSNPIAYLIPCHRVIRSTGSFSGYRWGVTRKKAMIAWEGNKTLISSHSK